MTYQARLMIMSVSSPPPTAQAAAELRATLGLLYRRLRQTRAAGDPSLPESTALSRLDRHGPITAAQLARFEQVSPQSIGATLQSLEARGLIDRAPDPTDGRRMILSLTQAGRETVHSKRAARTEQLTRALTALTPEERRQLIAALPALTHLAEEL
jgi:DNA-binding MarR family transcriptional regulator